jgi:tetratricopeptide (TPR) repeat protein
MSLDYPLPMAGGRRGRASQGSAGKGGVRGKIFKWIAAITAVISLVLGVQQVVSLGKAARDRRRQVSELLGMEKIQKESGNFTGAWASLEKASGLDDSSKEVRRAQEDLAMAWLEAGRVSSENAKFSEITDKVTPVLSRAVASEDRSRRADAYAHLGWADFLRSRDGVGADPEVSYRKALAEDPDNVYANAMLGHAALWHGVNLKEARRYFAAALATGRVREYVRGLQFAALLNPNSEEAEEEAIRVANEMRKSGEKLDAIPARYRDRLFNIYYGRARPPGPRPEFLAVVPPAEHLATFQWLFAGEQFEGGKDVLREYWQATLEEASGQSSEALRRLRSLRSRIQREGSASTLTDSVDGAIARLSRSKPG